MADAIGLVIGAICGTLAGVPVALLILAATGKSGGYAPERKEAGPRITDPDAVKRGGMSPYRLDAPRGR
jgi:hypothetical protein